MKLHDDLWESNKWPWPSSVTAGSAIHCHALFYQPDYRYAYTCWHVYYIKNKYINVAPSATCAHIYINKYNGETRFYFDQIILLMYIRYHIRIGFNDALKYLMTCPSWIMLLYIYWLKYVLSIIIYYLIIFYIFITLNFFSRP